MGKYWSPHASDELLSLHGTPLADGYSTKGLDGALNPYEGYVQSRMSCFNRGNIDEFFFTTELSRKYDYMVNRPVCFVVTDITEDENGKPIVMLSREKAQRKCLDAYISRLRCGDIVPARITHLENFGQRCHRG